MSLELATVLSVPSVSRVAASDALVFAAVGDRVNIYNGADRVLERSFVPAKGAVSDLVWAPKSQSLVIISGGKCLIYSVPLRRVLYEFPTTSASSVVTASTDTGDRIIVASKRKIRWVIASASSMSPAQQLALNERPYSMALSSDGDKLACAVGTDFLVVDLARQVVRKLGVPIHVSLFSSTPVHVAILGDIVVCAVGNSAKFVTTTGKLRFKVDWDSPPVALGTIDGFLLVVLDGKALAIDAQSGFVIDSVALTRDQDQVKGMAQKGFAWGKANVLQFKLDISQEYLRRLAEQNAEAAVSLLSQLPEFSENDTTFRDLNQAKAIKLFEEGNYDQAFEIFTRYRVPIAVITAKINEYLDSQAEQTPETGDQLNGDTSRADSASISDVASVFTSRSRRNRFPVIEAFMGYLTSTRRRINVEVAKGDLKETEAHADLELVDTALFRCYFVTSSSLLASLIRLQNRADPDVVSTSLLRVGKWHDLVRFLRGRELHERALQVIRDHGTSQELIQYLRELPELDGESEPGSASGSEFALMEEFATEPIKSDHDYARQLFMGAPFFGETSKVYEYLAAIDPKLAAEVLQHRISEGQETSEQMNHALASYYLDTNDVTSLERHLETSGHYNPRRVLQMIPSAQVRSRAIVHGRLNEHKKAIDLYLSIDDYDSARKYAENACIASAEEGQRAIIYLFDMALKNYPDRLQGLLEQQAHRIPLDYAIGKLSSDLKIDQVQAFLNTQTIAYADRAKLHSLATATGKAALAHKSWELSQASQVSQAVDASTTCSWCRKRLGKSVAGFTNDYIVHYACLAPYRAALAANANAIDGHKTM